MSMNVIYSWTTFADWFLVLYWKEDDRDSMNKDILPIIIIIFFCHLYYNMTSVHGFSLLKSTST